MGTVGAGFSISLDGFIADSNDDTSQVFAWMARGDTEVPVTIGDMKLNLMMSAASADLYLETMRTMGAIVSGRRLFDVAGAWGGKHPFNVPVFVVTHHVPQEWANREDSPFTFVTDGVESAIAQARKVAGDKNVGVGGANITQQALKAGLLEEIGFDLVPVLLGSGVRLFEPLGIEPVNFEQTKVVEGTGVTHLRFRVVK